MQKISYFLCSLIFLILSPHCFSQVEYINTDRPDQSDGVYTVPKNHFQLEYGIIVANQTFLNDVMLRYGLTKSTEFRLQLDAGKEVNGKGMKPVSISAKQRIVKQHKLLPAVSFVGYMWFENMASRDFKGNKIPYELKVAFENELSNIFGIAYNIGASDEFKALNLTFNLGITLSNKTTTFVEYFSTIKSLENLHNLDVGILVAPKPQLQFDIAIGNSMVGTDNSFFTTFGVSYIFNRKK